MITTTTIGSAHVRVWSAGDGSPLVYLHGYEQHPGGVGFLQRLSMRHHVIAPEHPGYGESTGAEQLEDLLDIVIHYRKLISSITAAPVDLIGHSLGGMLAAELAAACPHLVRRLVLVDAYGLWLDDVDTADPFYMTSAELKAAKWHDPGSAPKPEPSLAPSGTDDPLSAMIARTQNLATATKLMWPMPDRGLRRRLAAIESPTLVVHGQSDGLVPLAHAEELVRRIPGATLAVIACAGHLPMIEREDDFVAITERFLAR